MEENPKNDNRVRWLWQFKDCKSIFDDSGMLLEVLGDWWINDANGIEYFWYEYSISAIQYIVRMSHKICTIRLPEFIADASHFF